MIATREVSVAEVVAAHLERIRRFDPMLHAFITITADHARRDAEVLDEELRLGVGRGPLHGIPIAVKDLFDTAGVRTTGNSQVLLDRVPEEDATSITRLRSAGAVLLGKLQMHEFAIASPRRDDHFAPARNPWDLARVPGGSSSGSAVALSAGLCAGSLGTDTGGSIRTPSSLVGVVGLKPTWGVVSRHGILGLSSSLDHVGPMARTVRDVAILLSVIAGPDSKDPTTTGARITDYTAGLGRPIRGVRVGVPYRQIETAGMEPAAHAAFTAAVGVLDQLGATLEEVELPMVAAINPILFGIIDPELSAYHREWFASRPELYGSEARRRVLDATRSSDDDYRRAVQAREIVAAKLHELMQTVELLAMPTMRRGAPTFDEVEAEGFQRSPFTGLFSLAGEPAISIPCGFDRDGLPIGLMLAGRLDGETDLLRAAHAYESATPWHRQRPPLFWKRT